MIYIYSADGFVREFWDKAKEHKTLKGSYEAVEQNNIELFGNRKSSDYNFIKQKILDLGNEYLIQSICYDRWNASQLVIDLQN